jgi:hypothetical protein
MFHVAILAGKKYLLSVPTRLSSITSTHAHINPWIRVRGKFALKQATEAQRRSRGIALLFL